ncbi:MAG: DNA repair protein RadC [Parabacteroides sp.]|nr:DNA repair protein RadC [Parabacteroides sp.]
MKIKEWAEEDRPREKMLLKGVSTLSDAELLAILIGSGNNDETAVQLSQRILSSVENNLNALGKLSVKELQQFKGIGKVKAITINAALELGKRRGNSLPPKRAEIRSSQDAYRLFYPLLSDLPHEELWIALTNRSSQVLLKTKISQGGISETSADLRLILKTAINALASGIILCHNHPSGNSHPSRQDDQLTSQLKNAGKLMEIQLLDHIILCDGNYYSYADEGRL